MRRLLVALFAFSCLPVVVGAEVLVREVPVGVRTKKGEPVLDLDAAEVEVKEDGAKRTVVGLRRDESPVDVALILDSSERMRNDYRSTLVPAAMDFWDALPEGARLTIWTSGGGSHLAVEFGTERSAAEETLEKAAVGGNLFTLDAIVDASEQLAGAGAPRRMVVAVTTPGMPFSKSLIDRVYQAVPRSAVTPLVIMVDQSGTGGGQSWSARDMIDHMTTSYGGDSELTLTAQAVSSLLRRVAAELTSQYLVRFESEADGPGRPEVKVRRKGVVTRSGLAMRVR